MKRHLFSALLCLAGFATGAYGQPSSGDVVWDSPGKNFRDSMPIGNGDLGLNVWTEQNGDLVFLVGKDDAWTENAQLVKLGRIRVKISPNPFADAPGFRQELNLAEGQIQISDAAGDRMIIWVDANRPVAHVEAQTKVPTTLQANVELWRTEPRETRQGGAEVFGVGVLREWNNLPG